MLHLNKQGIETSNNKNGVYSLIIDKRVVGKIKHRGNMLPIKLAPVKESQVQYANKAVTNNDKKVLLWHHRIGHVNANTMKDCTNQGEEDDKYNDNKKIISWPLSPTVIGQSFIEPLKKTLIETSSQNNDRDDEMNEVDEENIEEKVQDYDLHDFSSSQINEIDQPSPLPTKEKMVAYGLPNDMK